jgi:hypothetical protein
LIWSAIPAASYWRDIADRATTRLIRERFSFAASLLVMLALVLLMGTLFMAPR